MACDLCEHCSSPMATDDRVICKGYSYHKECQKCFFCNEPNLQGAEMFKGFIFCSACSNRIFHSLMPDNGPDYCMPSEKNTTTYLYHKTDYDRESNYLNKRAKSKPVPITAHATELKYVRRKRTVPDDKMKKSIQDVEMLTEIKKDFIIKTSGSPTGPCYENIRSSQLSPKHTISKKENNLISDMRIAELGTSTEIANTALRKKSENAVVIKSATCLKSTTSSNPCALNSDVSGDGTPAWTETTYTSNTSSSKSEKKRWMNSEIRNMLKVPYKSFKKKILRRSSVVSALMSVEEEPRSIFKEINALFHEEITEHQRRGLQRLYSTINRNSSPHKLGWLHLEQKTPEGIGCKHIAQSHSYRCMRSNVMKRAGPTKSELAVIRAKVKRLIVPTFVRASSVDDKNSAHLKTSEDFGNANITLK